MLKFFRKGTFTPVDVSGAGLTFAVDAATFKSIFGLVHCYVQLGYPVTANASNAQIGGFPYQISNSSGDAAWIIFSDKGTGFYAVVTPVSGAPTVVFYSLAGVSLTNADLSGKYIILATAYSAVG